MVALEIVASEARAIYAVGRNYAAHAAELGNDIPTQPLWFMKSAASLCFGDRVSFPKQLGPIHFELEWMLRVGADLECGNSVADTACFSEMGLAIDFTARKLQTQLKEERHPWDRAKSFSNACWLGCMIPSTDLAAGFRFMLHQNGELRQKGASELMLYTPMELVNDLLKFISLRKGDLILTGTPEGVAEVCSGDVLRVSSPTLGLIRELQIT